MPRILALDVATHMGVAEGEPGLFPVVTTVKLGREGDDHADIFARAALWITRRMLDDPPDLVIFEEPVPKFDSSLLMGLRGVMLGITRAHAVKLTEVPVATWRLYFLGSGKLKRDIAKARAVETCARLGWGEGINHNAAEAAGMWLWACAKVAPTKVPRHEPLFLGSR